jgi:hypothetical protein
MNSKLSKLTRLSKSVAIMVPSTMNAVSDGKAKQAEWVDRLMAEFAKMFGGVTVYTVQGGWWSNDHGLIREGMQTVQSMATDDALDQHLETVIGLAEAVKADMGQEAVSLIVNGELYLV